MSDSQLAVLPREQAASHQLDLPAFSKPFQILDVYAPDGTIDATPRVDAIATISAGFKAPDAKFPSRSRDGKIILHDAEGRAPGLKAALAATGDKALTIAFPFDDMGMIIQQYFAEYSASNLLAWGDATQITVLDPQRVGKSGRMVYKAGTPEYREALDRCKPSSSIYFHLARWTDDGPEVFFPDGLGLYRLRFTSRNSIRSIVGSLQTTAKYMGGRLAGIPFKLSLENIEVAGSDGAKRKIGVWRCIFTTPTGFALSSQNFRDVATKALAQGSALMLPPPRAESLELAAYDGAEVDLDDITDAQIAEVATGGKCDSEHYRKHWFAIVQDTPLDLDEARADYVSWYSANFGFEVVSSLAKLLAMLNEEQAQHFMKSAAEELEFQLDQVKLEYLSLMEAGML
ncbi:hypothetical protein EON80_24480 [bacterium]|nr:MAG: hypothetical protein EON80_24480 [bacterium]